MWSLCLWMGFPARKAGQEGPPHHIPSVIRGMIPCNWRRPPAKSPQIQGQWDTERKEKKEKKEEKRKKKTDGPPVPYGSSQFHLCFTATQVVLPWSSKGETELLHQGKLWTAHAGEYKHFSQDMPDKLSEQKKLIPRLFTLFFITPKRVAFILETCLKCQHYPQGL